MEMRTRLFSEGDLPRSISIRAHQNPKLVGALASILASFFIACSSPAARASRAQGEAALDEIYLTHAGHNFAGRLRMTAV